MGDGTWLKIAWNYKSVRVLERIF